MTKTDGQLLAEFMGLDVYEKWSDVQAVPIDDLKPYLMLDQCDRYKKQWDHLMPVVEKIKTMWQNYQINDVRTQIESVRAYNSVCSMLISDPISEVYEKVVYFIHWYNSQPKA